MIKTKYLTPEIYYDHSRDFQLIGRLFDASFNYIHTNSGIIYDIPSSNMHNKALELLAYTLGFQSKHNYPINQLRAICSCMSIILRDKGTVKSIYDILNALLRAENISEQASVIRELDENDKYTNNLLIFIPNQLKDINLFKDLLDYVLPAGTSLTISRHSLVELSKESTSTTDDAKYSIGKKVYETSFVPKYGQGFDEEHSQLSGGRFDNSTIVPYDKDAKYIDLDVVEEREP